MELSGKRIRKLRNEKKLKQSELSEIIGVHEKTISKAERGKNGLSVDNLIALSEYFCVSLEYLVGFDMTIDMQHDEVSMLYMKCPNDRKELLIEVMKTFSNKLD